MFDLKAKATTTSARQAATLQHHHEQPPQRFVVKSTDTSSASVGLHEKSSSRRNTATGTHGNSNGYSQMYSFVTFEGKQTNIRK